MGITQILIISLLLTVITASVLFPLPEFTTDLSSFAPESEAKSAEERMNLVMEDTPNRIYVHVTPNEEGGLKDWIKEKAIHFSTPYKEEHFILATEIHKEYESLIETHLYQFCEEENIDYKDFYATLVQAKTVSGMSKTINMLLASASYKKFYKLMHRKWKEYYKDYSDTNNNNSEKIADMEDKNNNRRGSLSPHHVKIVEYNNVNNLLSSSLCRNNNEYDDDDMKPMMNSKK